MATQRRSPRGTTLASRRRQQQIVAASTTLAGATKIESGGTGANSFTASEFVRCNAAGTALESSGSTSGSFPASSVTFVTMSAEASCSAERVLTAGTGISRTDGGANSTVTLAVVTSDLFHNDLSTKQGGTAGEFYHLTSAEYTGTGTGVFVRSSSPTLTTPTIGSFANANHNHQAGGGGGQLDHGAALTGLTDDDHTQYAMLAGRSGGQTIIGGTGSGDDLTLKSTSHGTKGFIYVGANLTSYYDEVQNRLVLSNDATVFAPTALLTFVNTDTAIATQLGTTYAGQMTYNIRRANGTVGTPTKVLSGESIAQYAIAAHDGSAFSGAAAGMRCKATADWSSTSHPCNLIFLVTAASSTLPEEAMVIDPNGNVLIGTTTSPTGTAVAVLQFAANGGNPTPATDTACVFSKLVAGVGEVFVTDEGGTTTQISRHYDPDLATLFGLEIPPDDPFPAIDYEENVYLGLRAITYTHYQTGKRTRVLIPLPPAEVQDWTVNQIRQRELRARERDRWYRDQAAWLMEQAPEPPAGANAPPEHALKQPPGWLRKRGVRLRVGPQ